MPHSVQTTTAPPCYCVRQQGEDVRSETRSIILLVEDDDDTRPVLKSNLERDGYRVLIALSEEDAFDRTGGGQFKADLILVNLVESSPDDALKAARRIREHAKYDSATPIVVMADKYGKDLEGTDVQVSENEWVTYLEDPHQLENLLARILSRHSN